MIAENNDVDFELINKSAEAVKFLQGYKPKNKTTRIQNQIEKRLIIFIIYSCSDKE